MRKIFSLKIILAVLIFAVLVIGVFLVVYNKNQEKNYKIILNDKEALLIINYGKKGNERWFKGIVENGMTVKNVLEAASIGGKFTFSANSHLSMLDGIYNNAQKRWKCYLNEREVQEGIDRTTISPQDKIMCVYK